MCTCGNFGTLKEEARCGAQRFRDMRMTTGPAKPVCSEAPRREGGAGGNTVLSWVGCPHESSSDFFRALRPGARIGVTTIRIETTRCSSPDLQLMAHETEGVMTAEDGRRVGTCTFLTYRRKLNGPSLDTESIYFELDEFSDSAVQVVDALVAWNQYELEYYFNESCVLVAERVEIDPAYRGDAKWKHLYFQTMAGALAGQRRRRPDQFFFKVFPLEFERKVTDENRSGFEVALRSLKLLYSIHLGARSLDLPSEYGCFMRAPVPERVARDAEFVRGKVADLQCAYTWAVDG